MSVKKKPNKVAKAPTESSGTMASISQRPIEASGRLAIHQLCQSSSASEFGPSNISDNDSRGNSSSSSFSADVLTEASDMMKTAARPYRSHKHVFRLHMFADANIWPKVSRVHKMSQAAESMYHRKARRSMSLMQNVWSAL